MATRVVTKNDDVLIDSPRIRQTAQEGVVNSSDLWLAKAYQVVWFLLAIIEIILGFRIILKLLAANSFAGFSSLIYSLSYPLVTPFVGIFRTEIGPAGSTIEWSAILAAIVYAVLAWVIVYLIGLIHPPHPNHISSEEIVET